LFFRSLRARAVRADADMVVGLAAGRKPSSEGPARRDGAGGGLGGGAGASSEPALLKFCLVHQDSGATMMHFLFIIPRPVGIRSSH
jgi:uncharacterized spore protein YtfJ